MIKKKFWNNVGAWAFLIGVILALVLGLLSALDISARTYNLLIAVLVIAGTLVGLFNVKNNESLRFLLAGVSLVIVSSMGQTAISALNLLTIRTFSIGVVLGSLFNALLILFVPTTIIVALKSVFEVAKN
jgi:hypothetical protein